MSLYNIDRHLGSMVKLFHNRAQIEYEMNITTHRRQQWKRKNAEKKSCKH